MNVPKSVELVDRNDHLCSVEQRIFFVHDSSVVQESTEVAARNVLHCEVDVQVVLEGIKKAYKPGGSSSGEDVAFYQHMSDLQEASNKILR